MRLCLESRRRSRRSPPPAKTWVTCWRTGDSRGSSLIFHEIYRPVSLLDGSVELAPLAGQGVRERRLAVGERRGEVRPVDAPYTPLELGDQPLRLIEELLGIFRRTLTLLDESALLEPPSQYWHARDRRGRPWFYGGE